MTINDMNNCKYCCSNINKYLDDDVCGFCYKIIRYISYNSVVEYRGKNRDVIINNIVFTENMLKKLIADIKSNLPIDYDFYYRKGKHRRNIKKKISKLIISRLSKYEH